MRKLNEKRLCNCNGILRGGRNGNGGGMWEKEPVIGYYVNGLHVATGLAASGTLTATLLGTQLEGTKREETARAVPRPTDHHKRNMMMNGKDGEEKESREFNVFDELLLRRERLLRKHFRNSLGVVPVSERF
ncbi:hypothetical protein PRIPAC_81491 [Pristionchus pacificus]|uniref:Uncharacterized protein n=1 Tax=Pristionchus pacificus TaxID=54126 RepID=A0A2A6CKE7_PRIPA|nr:hypothetical protein PRIPAC_81491 [Pristionchus pacificus]|eukprot:PDM78558.1 hypothetical protein PRIPAC_31137 [Pristionchus pacificus]